MYLEVCVSLNRYSYKQEIAYKRLSAVGTNFSRVLSFVDQTSLTACRYIKFKAGDYHLYNGTYFKTCSCNYNSFHSLPN
jgi:hypothetical protein